MWLVGSKPIKSNVVQQHLFRAFCVIANSWRSESTVSFAQMTSCAIRYDVIYHPFAMNSQYLKTWGVGWQPCRSHRRGSKHKELAALIAERSVPITQFMSSRQHLYVALTNLVLWCLVAYIPALQYEMQVLKHQAHLLLLKKRSKNSRKPVS